jgi:hypothetical protein
MDKRNEILDLRRRELHNLKPTGMLYKADSTLLRRYDLSADSESASWEKSADFPHGFAPKIIADNLAARGPFLHLMDSVERLSQGETIGYDRFILESRDGGWTWSGPIGGPWRPSISERTEVYGAWPPETVSSFTGRESPPRNRSRNMVPFPIVVSPAQGIVP